MVSKKIFLLIGIILISFLFFGCTENSTGPQNNPTQQNTASICGNGIVESGETMQTCCQDVGCDDFFTCKLIEQDSKSINTCVKQTLEETKEYKDFLTALDEETAEYDKQYDLVNYDYILNKINQMEKSITKLEFSFDVAIEKTYIQYRKDRREWNIKRNTLSEELDSAQTTDDLVNPLEEVIALDKAELERLNSFTDSQVETIKDKFDYDISDYKVTLSSYISEMEDRLEAIKEGYQLELEVIDYKSTCNSDWYCFLEYVKVKIKNTGKLPFANPTFDFYVKEGDKTISRDIDYQDYSINTISPNSEATIKATYIGYDDKEDIKAGNYTLRVDLKQGISTKIISTTNVSIKIK